MTRKRLVALPIFLIVLLSAIGISYAAWFDTITLVGRAETGELEFPFHWFEPPRAQEYYIDHISGSLEEGEWLDKEVGVSAAWYEGEKTLCETCACPPDGKTGPSPEGIYGYEFLVIEVDNAYPGYVVGTTFTYWNPGSIPLEVVGIDFMGSKDCDPTAVLFWDYDGAGSGDVYQDRDGDGLLTEADEPPIAGVTITGIATQGQIDPCLLYEKDEIDIEFYQPIEECCTYTFKFRFNAIQWNKLYEADDIEWLWPELPV